MIVWIWAALAVAGFSALGVIVFALRTNTDSPPPPRRCPSCGKRQGVKGRPLHITPADPVNGRVVSWGVICDPCWLAMPKQRRYEFYSMQARRWNLQATPEFAAIRASIEVGL